MKAADKNDTNVEQTKSDEDATEPKKRGRSVKTAPEKPVGKPDQPAPKAAEAGQEGKRPRGRPPGETDDAKHIKHYDHACDTALTVTLLVSGTGKKQKAAAEQAAAKEASKDQVQACWILYWLALAHACLRQSCY